MAYKGALPFPETQNRAKKCRKTHPEFVESGEIASEDGRKVMDDEKTVNMI
jgi:polyhydroxyalkanoate synthesis regulator phasin